MPHVVFGRITQEFVFSLDVVDLGHLCGHQKRTETFLLHSGAIFL